MSGRPEQTAVYRGRTHYEATRAYHDDAWRAIEHGYVPIAESWARAFGLEILTVTYGHVPADVAAVRGQIVAAGLVRSAELTGVRRPVGVPAPDWGAGQQSEPQQSEPKRRWWRRPWAASGAT